MRAFWYISDSKLEAYLNPSISDQVKASFRLALGPLSAEVGPSDRPSARSSAVARFEDQIRGSGVQSAHELETNAAPAFFRFSGRSVRAIQEDVFYFACLDGTTAVLLVGSPRNLIGVSGAPANHEGFYFSPSAQPMRYAVGFGSDENEGSAAAPSMLTYAWASLMESARYGVPTERLPQTAGVAVYSGVVDAQPAQLERFKWQHVDRLALGSPVFVEQLGD